MAVGIMEGCDLSGIDSTEQSVRCPAMVILALILFDFHLFGLKLAFKAIGFTWALSYIHVGLANALLPISLPHPLLQ